MSSSMQSRRVPLSVNSNAANSPLRTGTGNNHLSASAAAAAFAKQRRSHASVQREENYGLAPPAKKQMLEKVDNNVSASASTLTSTTSALRRVPVVQRASMSRSYQAERVSSHHQQQQQQSTHHSHQSHHHIQVSQKEAEEVRRWQQSQRLRFPKLVFYFDNLPEDQSARLSKQVSYLGAREDKFFSIDITHVVTTRSIPPEDKVMAKRRLQDALDAKENDAERAPEASHEQMQTINPSLLSRSHVNELGISTTSLPVKRKLFDTAHSRRLPVAAFGGAEDAIRKPKPTRSTDILQRAREMGKKIWSLEKLQKVLDMLLEPDPYRSAELGQRMRNGSTTTTTAAQQSNGRFGGDHVLLQMMDKERHSGPSDRDPTVATRELIYFKGPYIYVYDIEEKQRPIMVREYAKVADREEGDWPQLRPSAGTRCPFIEDTDQLELRAEKKRARMRPTATVSREVAREAPVSTATGSATGSAGTATNASIQKTLASRYAAAATAASNANAPAKQVTGKRTLAEMEDGHNRQSSLSNGSALANAPSLRPADGVFGSTVAGSAGSVSSVASAIPPSKSARASIDYQAQNAFTSRAKSARCFAGEPVASGLQAAGITSAIRSQMISSATGTLGARAGTSKEIHGLQRKVLQKSTSTAQQDLSSRHMTDASMDQQQQHAQQHAQQQGRPTYSRSTSLSRSTAAAQLSAKLNMAIEGSTTSNNADDKHKRTMSAPVAVQVQPRRKRDPKPGYCENCQDKFDDFEDHIVSHKHRKFAEDERNWTDLDELLGQLTRTAKYGLSEW
ncbi:Cdc7p-Dbf4p kinase complex regulatory subunit [Sporothrix curviconia]|uniref:Cdc7p-Dbf4p kinase complex regulatory subunit n=1 Tax=Sporothrix curviconia TaxID=1260050 RepID=A0ABP0B3R7_9PEZI